MSSYWGFKNWFTTTYFYSSQSDLCTTCYAAQGCELTESTRHVLFLETQSWTLVLQRENWDCLQVSSVKPNSNSCWWTVRSWGRIRTPGSSVLAPVMPQQGQPQLPQLCSAWSMSPSPPRPSPEGGAQCPGLWLTPVSPLSAAMSSRLFSILRFPFASSLDVVVNQNGC